MKPIWFFVGLLLLVMGVIVAAAGGYDLVHPSKSPTLYGDLHPSLWWGMLMIVVGTVFFFVWNKKEPE